MNKYQKDVEEFESHWRLAMVHLKEMAGNPILVSTMYLDFITRVQSLESLVIDISDCVRSDKD
jgi:hypothetical protein